MSLKSELLQLAKVHASRSTVRMAFVPNVIDCFDVGTPETKLAICHLLLLELDRQGLIELQPDSGRSRFTVKELEACPDGPDGSKLLWIRICNVRQTGIE